MVRRIVVKDKTFTFGLMALVLALSLAVTAWVFPVQAQEGDESDSSEGEDTPAPAEEETPAPAEETPAPAEEEKPAAAAEETPAPAEEEKPAAAAEETPAPAEEEKPAAAAEETPAPAEETPAPAEEEKPAAAAEETPTPAEEAPAETEEPVPLLDQMKGLEEISGGEGKPKTAPADEEAETPATPSESTETPAGGEIPSGDETPAGGEIPSGDETPAAEESEAVPPAGEGTEAIAEPQIEVQRLTPEEMAAFQEQLTELRERIMTSKARLMQLREQLMLGSVSIIALSIVHQHEVGGTFKLETLSYILDGFEIYAGVNSPENNLDKLEEFPVYEGSLLPGDHLLVVDMIFRGRGYGVFSYLNQYLFKVKARYLFTVNEGDVVTINVVSYDEGSFLTSLKDRLKVRFEMK